MGFAVLSRYYGAAVWPGRTVDTTLRVRDCGSDRAPGRQTTPPQPMSTSAVSTLTDATAIIRHMSTKDVED